MKNVATTIPILALTATVMAMVASGCLRKDQEDVKGPPVASVTPDSLCAIYEKGPSKAKHKYTGNIIKVSGRVHRKETDVMSQVYILLRARSGDDVQCFFANKWAKKLIKIEEGEKVVVKGRCVGRNIKVQMKGCVLLSP